MKVTYLQFLTNAFERMNCITCNHRRLQSNKVTFIIPCTFVRRLISFVQLYLFFVVPLSVVYLRRKIVEYLENNMHHINTWLLQNVVVWNTNTGGT